MGARAARRPTPGARREHLLRVVGLGISVIAIAIVLQSMDLAAAARILGRADLTLLLVVLGILAVQLSLRAYRWRVLLPHSVDNHPIPVIRVIPPLLAGYLGNAVLPARLGEPIRAALVARRERLDGLECFGTTITERVIDTATLAIIAFTAAVAAGAAVWIVFITGAAGLAGAILLVLLVTVGLTFLASFLARVLLRNPSRARAVSVARWTLSFARGVDRGRTPRRFLVVVAISCICWGIDATVFWLIAQAIDVPMAFPAAVLIAAVTVLGTAVPSAPGYVGTFELAATSTALALGIPKPEGLAVAILAHVSTVVPLAIAGVAATILMGTGLTHLSEQVDATSTQQPPGGSPVVADAARSE